MPEKKQFVKAKPLNGPKDRGGGSAGYQQRQPRKANKKYEEKTQPKDNREGIKLIFNAFEEVIKSDIISDLQQKYPKLFVNISVQPQLQENANLNDFLKGGLKVRTFAIGQVKHLSSGSSEPDWQSDCEKQIKLESKRIDEKVIKKVEQYMKKKPLKRIDQLQRHEKQFLEDHYIKKRNRQIQEKNQDTEKNKHQKQEKQEKLQKQEKNQNRSGSWNQYTHQVDNLITEGHLQKIQAEEGEDFQMGDDFSFQEEQQGKKSDSPVHSDESDGDDMFADDQPRTVSEKKIDNHNAEVVDRKGTVFINNHMFSQIAQTIGLPPGACTWIISNKTERYRVTTQYMNLVYRDKHLYETFPYISLNHSEFVRNQDIETERGLEKFKRFNERKKNNYQKQKQEPQKNYQQQQYRQERQKKQVQHKQPEQKKPEPKKFESKQTQPEQPQKKTQQQSQKQNNQQQKQGNRTTYQVNRGAKTILYKPRK